MAPNVVIRVPASGGLATVLVGGEPLAGCVGVKATKEVVEISGGNDGRWLVGNPVWHISIDASFLTVELDNGNGAYVQRA